MKFLKIVFFLTGGSLILLGISTPVAAQTQTAGGQEPNFGLPLCQPGPYLYDPQDCLPLGPSVTITHMAEKGIVYPFIPLQAHKPDPALNDTELKFAKINVPPPDKAPIYASFDDAMTGNNPTGSMEPGNLIYVSYKNISYNGSDAYAYLTSGAWMRASPISSINTFQGLEFPENADSTLGWIVQPNKPRVEAGYQAKETDKTLAPQTSVQIYDTLDKDGTKWYMVGMGQWVERQYIRQLVVNPTPPEGVTNNRWIEVNLYEQTLSIYEGGKLKFATLIASGIKPYYTQPGLFKIYKKKPTETMRGAFEADKSDFYYLEDVPWTLYFDKLRAIHGAYWRAMFGFEQSHGCINMSIGDAHWVYNWAQEGDAVYVHDPSGMTPTDPQIYKDGGA